MQLWQYCLLVTARSLYMFRTLSASIIGSTNNCSNSHWCMPWDGMMYFVYSVRMSKVGCHCSRYVCTYVRTYVRIYVCMYACTYAYVYV